MFDFDLSIFHTYISLECLLVSLMLQIFWTLTSVSLDGAVLTLSHRGRVHVWWGWHVSKQVQLFHTLEGMGKKEINSRFYAWVINRGPLIANHTKSATKLIKVGMGLDFQSFKRSEWELLLFSPKRMTVAWVDPEWSLLHWLPVFCFK